MTQQWFSVRCVLQHSEGSAELGPWLYEERVTLWLVENSDAAIALAEEDATRHAAAIGGCEYINLAQSYALVDNPGNGGEVFSLVRESALDADDYLDQFFDTGMERQQIVRSEADTIDEPDA